jgi:hypothetical protein
MTIVPTTSAGATDLGAGNDGAPGPAVSVEATPGNGSAVVVWSPPDSEGGAPIARYEVTSKPLTTTCRVSAAPLECSFNRLVNGTPYSFSVVAINELGLSKPASFGPITPSAPPGAPTGVSATPGTDGLLVRWNPPANDGGTAVASYQAKAYGSGGVAGTCVPGTGEHQCLISGLALGGVYNVGVTATSDGGLVGPEGLAPAPVGYTFAPAAPTDVQLKASDGAIEVRWTPSATDGGMAIDRYAATVKDERGTTRGTCEFRPSPGVAPSCTVSGLENGMVVSATVVAWNQVGPSKASDASPTSAPEIGEASSIDEAFSRLLKGIKVDLRTDGATVSLEIPKTTKIAGISVHGTASVRFEPNKVTVWTVEANLPGLLGDTRATLEAVVQDTTVTSLVVSAKTGTIGGLFALHNANLTFEGSDWKIAATVATPDGKTSQLDGTLSYGPDNALIGGGIQFTGLSIAGLLDIDRFEVRYHPATGYSGGISFTALPDGMGNGAGAGVTFGFSPDGRLTSGLVEAKNKVSLFGVIELRKFRLAFDSATDRWDAAVDVAPQLTADGPFKGGASSFDLKVEGGAITGANFTLGRFVVAGVIGVDKAHFNYSSGPGFETYRASASVILPGASGSAIGGSFTFRNGRYLDGSVEGKHLSIHITHGVFLQAISAEISIGSETQPWHLGGGAAISYGPSAGGASPIEVAGTIDYTFPTETAVLGRYVAAGSLSIAGAEIANALLSVTSENPVKVAAWLGPGDGTTGLAYGTAARITGLISGEMLSTSYALRGSVAIDLAGHRFGASSLMNQNGIGACADLSPWGTYGVIWPWTTSPYLMLGDCTLLRL